MINVVFADVDSIDFDEAAVIGMQTLKQARDGGFTRTAFTHHTQGRALWNFKGNPVQRGRYGSLVFEGDVRELDEALDVTANTMACSPLLGRLVDQVSDQQHRRPRLIQL